jgi:hypothetical protein
MVLDNYEEPNYKRLHSQRRGHSAFSFAARLLHQRRFSAGGFPPWRNKTEAQLVFVIDPSWREFLRVINIAVEHIRA